MRLGNLILELGYVAGRRELLHRSLQLEEFGGDLVPGGLRFFVGLERVGVRPFGARLLSEVEEGKTHHCANAAIVGLKCPEVLIVVVVRRQPRILAGKIHRRPQRPVFGFGPKVLRSGMLFGAGDCGIFGGAGGDVGIRGVGGQCRDRIRRGFERELGYTRQPGKLEPEHVGRALSLSQTQPDASRYQLGLVRSRALSTPS